MGENIDVSATYQFRGSDYIVSICVDEDNQLTVEVEEKGGGNQWRANYDSSYIEELTHKTGNFKQFTVFVSMLESAVIQSSDAVSLDLLTYADLESLRNKKAGVNSKVNSTVNRSSTLNSKRYLILTYTVEFDRIHYPLPLPYIGQPDPRKLQETIRNLQHDIKVLKKHGVKDMQQKEHDRLKREYDKLSQEKEDIEADFIDFKRQVQNTTKGSAAKEIRILKGIIKNLEEELLTEKTKYQRSSSKVSKEYRQLADEVEDLRASERNLRVRVKSLTNELNVYKRGRARSNTNASTSSRQSYSRERNSSRNNSLVRSRNSSRENSFTRDDSRLSSRENSRLSRSSKDSRSSYTKPRTSYLHNNSRERSLSRDRLLSRDKPVGRSSSLTRGRSSSREGNATLTRNRSNSNDRYTRPVVNRGGAFNRDRSLSRERPFSYNDRLRDRSTSRDRSYNSRYRSPSPSSAGARNPRFDPSAYIKEKERKRKETDLRKKRQIRSSWNADNRNQGPSSRSSSVGSVRSRNSSVESLSDIPGDTDASESKLSSRRNFKVLKPSKRSNSNGWSSPDVSFSKPAAPVIKESKILASTPESGIIKTQSRVSRKENVEPKGSKNYYDRVDEISEIDARLNRLQEFMKSNLKS